MLLSKHYLNIYSTYGQSQQITNIICNYCKFIGDSEKCIICDATAGMGGNSISFCKKFKFVFSIEISSESVDYLYNNLKNCTNVCIIQDNCLDILKLIKCNIIFFDPPWGGKDYKLKSHIDLFINNINILDIIENMYNYVNIIALKAPLNYNEEKFKKSKWNIKRYNILKNDKINIFYYLYIFYKNKYL